MINLISNYACASIVWVILFVARFTMILLGLVIVPLALPFRKVIESDRVPVGTFEWKMMVLPSWAWFWSNNRDGCLGDVRGNYNDYQCPRWLIKSEYLSSLWWLAIRNPANNFSRFTPVVSCDMNYGHAITLQGQDIVKDRAGQEGFQFVRCIGRWFVPYWGLYYVARNGFIVRLGHKMDVEDNDKDWSADPTKAWKGMTFRVALEDI